MRRKLVLVVLCVVLLSVTGFVSGHAQSSGPIKLKYANYFPVAHFFSAGASQFCDEIKKRTNGRVEISYYPGGTLSTAPNVFKNVVNGLSDIGLSHIGYTRGRFPATEILDLPLGYSSAFVESHVRDDFYNKFKLKEWDEVHALYFFAPGPQIIATKTKPVRKLEELKGLKFRGIGRPADTLTALGATPVALEMVDQYDALQRGLLDGTYETMETWKGFKLGEQIKYATLCQRATGTTYTFYVVMNKEKWNGLPDDVKKIFTQMSAEWADKSGLAAFQADIEARDFFLQRGGQLIPLPDEEVRKWAKAVEPVVQNYMKDMEGKGYKRSEMEEHLKFIRERIVYWDKQEKERGLKSPYIVQ
jgi:TRAP-type transport system periplasmic protein